MASTPISCFTWRRQQCAAGDLHESPQLAPVKVTAEAIPGIAATASEPVGRMEIVLGVGDRIIVGADVDTRQRSRA
jgi:hypothetical protein